MDRRIVTFIGRGAQGLNLDVCTRCDSDSG
jgi:hypothetical protein